MFREHASAVRRAATRAAQGDQAAADDATQCAFIEAVSIWVEFRELPPTWQRAWLRSRACKRVIDGWRATRQIVTTELVPEEKKVLRSAEDIVLAKIALDRCLKVIDGMAQRPRQVAYLKWHEGWTNTKIAKHLGIDRATVLRDLRSVVATVKEQVGDEVPFPVSNDDGEEA